MLSTWVYPFTEGHADSYEWDGSFLRTVVAPGNTLASVDGRYFVDYTRGQLWSSSGNLVRAFVDATLEQGSTSFNWAADGDYLCALQETGIGYALAVQDVTGNARRIQLKVPSDVVAEDGLRAMGIGCSLTTNRAVVFGGSLPNYRVALMSLADGRPIADLQLGVAYAYASSDLRWLAEIKANPGGGSQTEVVDLTDGSLEAKLDGYFDSFTPDGLHLVGTNNRGVSTLVDWRTKTELWHGPGHLATAIARSDPATNMMLLWLSTGSAQAGTETYDYWIVGGAGTAFRFTPRGCVSIVDSPKRACEVH